MTALANLFMRVFLLTFILALFLTGCAREKPGAGYWGDLSKAVKETR